MTDNKFSSAVWDVVDAGEEHIPQIRALFESVFKSEMSAAHWHWKYGEGRGVGVVVCSGDEVIAYFGGIKRRVIFRGDELCALQCGDTMVAEKHRGTLSKKGPFYLSVTTLLDKYLGYDRPHLLSYGFPNSRAMRLAKTLGLYTDVGGIVEVAWSADSSSTFRSEAFDFESAEHHKLLDTLWTQMSADLADKIVGSRDLQYLCDRYRDHPQYQYDIKLVFGNNDDASIEEQEETPMGIIITRQDDDRVMLMDMISSIDNFSALATFGAQLTSKQNLREMHGWYTETDTHFLSGSSVIIRDIGIRLPFPVYNPGLKPKEMKDAWFFMSGDTDFL